MIITSRRSAREHAHGPPAKVRYLIPYRLMTERHTAYAYLITQAAVTPPPIASANVGAPGILNRLSVRKRLRQRACALAEVALD